MNGDAPSASRVNTVPPPGLPAVPGDTLASLLARDRVSWDILHDRYGPLLELVRIMIGVVPNCDRYLEIWEPAFRTYNILMPNFFNVPFSSFGLRSAPADIVGMGMYVASRTAECPYCSAHTCSFALRRGASPEKLAQALVGGETFTPGELATIAVARSLARVPSEVTVSERAALTRCFGPEKAEWIVLGIVMTGFLNKFMDTIGVELEDPTVAEVSTTMGTGWSPGRAGGDLNPTAPALPPRADTLRTKLAMLPLLPAAVRLDTTWQRGVPGTWPKAGAFLRDLTGHDFPVLSRLRHGRAIKSVASILRENLDPKTTVVGLETKVLVGVIFAEIVADQALAADVRALAPKNGVTEPRLNEARRFAVDPNAEPPGGDSKRRAALLLARAASPSPAEIDTGIVSACRDAEVSAPAIVEVVTWLAVLQMLHRLTSYYEFEPAVSAAATGISSH